MPSATKARRASTPSFLRAALALAGGAASACQLVAGIDDPLPRPASATTDPRGSDGGSVIGADGGASTPSEYAKAVLTDAPTLYLRFSETSGVRVRNLGSAGGEVVLSGSAVRGRPSLVGGDDPSVGLGDGAQLTLDTAYDYPLATPFTYELWVRPTRFGDVLSNQVNTPDLYGTAIYLTDRGFPYLGFERWGGTIIRFAHSEDRTPPAAGTLFHIVVVNNAARPSLFVNGTRYDGYANDGKALPPPSALALGSGAKGDYDEVAIYDHALSPERVLAHYAAGRP